MWTDEVCYYAKAVDWHPCETPLTSITEALILLCGQGIARHQEVVSALLHRFTSNKLSLEVGCS